MKPITVASRNKLFSDEDLKRAGDEYAGVRTQDGRLHVSEDLFNAFREGAIYFAGKVNHDRILELELEVKRLREALEIALRVKCHSPKCYDYSERGTPKKVECICGLDKAMAARSTPPPALAEAYVRLRDAAKGVGMNWKLGAPYGQDALDAALAEIERLEKGE